MHACTPGPTYDKDISDVTVCPWGDDTGICVFLTDPVPITDIKTAQKQVHSDYTQDAIISCETATSDKVPFISLKLTDFGHPQYEGVFPACTNAAQILKKHVEKLPLQNDNNTTVDETNAEEVNALNTTLSKQSKSGTETVLEWSKEWHRDKLVEKRSQREMNAHTILITKCLGADKDFRVFYEVR